MGKKRGGQKKAEGKKWTKDPKPRREFAPVAAIEPFHPAAQCVRRRAPVAHRGSGDGTPGVGASERIPPETQLIGVAVRRATPGDGTFMYGEVLEYSAKANRFLVRCNADESESDEHFALMTYAEVIRDRVGSERSDDGLDMDAPYCLPCNTKTLWVLDLFSCLKSVKRGLEDVLRDYRRKGWTLQIVHLDLDRRRDPDVLCDIRDWKKELVDELGFRPFDFHIIWMSPDCRFFSQAGNPTSTNIAHGVELVAAARDVCQFFKPQCFFLENPWCGPRCLRKQEVAEDLLPFHVECCYCMYSEDGIMKPTSIFTNVPNLVLEFCSASNSCHWLKAGHSRHRISAQRGRSASGTPGSPLDMAIAVPKGLMVILMDAALRFITDTRLQYAAARRADGTWMGFRSTGRKNFERRKRGDARGKRVFPSQFKNSAKRSRGVFGKSARTTVCDSSVRDAKTRLLAHSKLSPSFFPSVVIHVRASSLLRAHRTTAVARSPRKRSRIDGSIGPIGPRIALRRSSRGGTRHARLARRVRVPLAFLLNV